MPSPRPTAIALGTLALYGMVLVARTAALAGSLAGRSGCRSIRSRRLLFGLSVAHGLLSGSDTPVLWAMYVVTGMAVATLQVTRMVAPPVMAEAW